MEFLQNMPPWALKLLGVVLALVVVALSGLGLSRLYRRLTDRYHLE